MSTTTTGKRSLAVACGDAVAFRELFAGCYERWEVAGSIRRQVREVGDVEHVVIPKFGEVPAAEGNLFGGTVTANLVWHRLERLLGDPEQVRLSRIQKHIYSNGPRWGEKYRGVDWCGFNHEIFTADADNLGAILAIRTGPAEFSRMLVTQLQFNGYMNRGGYVWNKRDWCCTCGWAGTSPKRKHGKEWTDKFDEVDGAHFPAQLPSGAFVDDPEGRDSGPWVNVCPNCEHHDTIRMAKVPAPTEEGYFQLCGVKYREPEARR